MLHEAMGTSSEDPAPAHADADDTPDLLRRWHGGDRQALRELLNRHLGWVRSRVQQRLGDALRQNAETDDFLHEAVIEILEYTPRFLATDGDTFRRLVTRIVENMLREQHEFYGRMRRDRARQAPLPDDSVLCLDPRRRTATSPSQHAVRNEEEAWLRLAMELLPPEERDVIVLREWQGRSFGEIGEQLGIAENAARMRFARALARLADRVESLRRGEV